MCGLLFLVKRGTEYLAAAPSGDYTRWTPYWLRAHNFPDEDAAVRTAELIGQGAQVVAMD